MVRMEAGNQGICSTDRSTLPTNLIASKSNCDSKNRNKAHVSFRGKKGRIISNNTRITISKAKPHMPICPSHHETKYEQPGIRDFPNGYHERQYAKEEDNDTKDTDKDTNKRRKNENKKRQCPSKK